MRQLTHGTIHAYRRHRLAGETPCPSCSTAQADRQRLARARTCDRMQLPVDLIAELYLAAPPEVQERVDGYLTSPVVDVLVDRRDTAARYAATSAVAQ